MVSLCRLLLLFIFLFSGCAALERVKNIGQPDKETVLGCIEYCIEENK